MCYEDCVKKKKRLPRLCGKYFEWLRHASRRPGDATVGRGCCLVVSQSDLTNPGQKPLSHPPQTPPLFPPFLGSFPFSLKCLGYLAQSITLCKEQWLCVCLKWVGVGCVCMWWGRREGSGCEVGVRNRWLGSVCLSLSHLGGFSPSAFDRLTRIHPPAQEGPRAHVRAEPTPLSHTACRRTADTRALTKHLPASSYWRSLGGTRELC